MKILVMIHINKASCSIIAFMAVLLANLQILSGGVNDGLVAYFPLDGNATDMVSGTTGTIYGATTVPNRWGMANSAFSFDGTDDYIEVPYQSSYSSNLFTFSLWVNPSANPSSYQSPFTFRGSNTGFMLYIDPSNTWSPWVGTGSSWGTGTNLGTITLNEWVFLACTYSTHNGTAFAGYKNGSLVSTSYTSFAPNTSSPLRIGAGDTDSTTPNYFFNGKMDELRFYNRALSDAEIKQLQIIDNSHFKDVSDLGYTYVDENLSNGGPWALLGYATNGNFTSKLTVASGQIDEGRQGSAVLNALSFAQSAPKLAITWTNNGSPKPNGGIDSYDHGVAFEFNDPSLLTLTAGQTPSSGSGLTNWSTASTDPSTVLLNLEVIKGSPNLPDSMYARRETFGAMYGNAYGFAQSSSNAQLDWTVDGQAFNVLYLGLNGNNGYVAPGSGGNANGYVPSTMAIWGQLETAPYDLRTSGNLSITENSSAGTFVDQFTATDNNDDSLSFSLLPVLPSELSPVLWLDANDSSKFSPVNGKISQWQDKSGNNYHYSQSDSTRYPSYSSNSLNGLPSITFDGNDFLTINSRLGFAANPDISVFAVTSFISNIASDNRIFQLGNSDHSLAVAGGSGSWSWRFNGGNEVYSSVVLNSVGQQAWVRQQGSNYAASQFFINGTEQTRVIGASDSTVPSDTASASFIGAGASVGAVQNTLFSNVKISELIVLNDSSEISRKAVETYLARKWGLNYPHATSNGMFELESNGTLKTLVSLDRETSASYPIVVRATDTNGNFIDQNFSVSVLDDGQEDTDSDGFLDSVEYDAGSDPESNSSIPGLDYGMIAWYPFDGNASDMSGNGRDGTALNGAGWSDGKLGQALSLDGINDYVDVGDFEIGGAVTFAAWVKYDAFKKWSRVFDFGNGENNQNILMANDMSTSASRFNLHLPSGSPSLNGSNLTLNSWIHRVGVIKANGNMELYLNGNLDVSNVNTAILPTLTRTQQFVGRSNWSVDEYLDGLIDDFRIYGRALSADQISELYQMPGSDADGDGFTYTQEYDAGTNPDANDSMPGHDYLQVMDGLVAWYPLDGNLSDASGNGRDATLQNTNGVTGGFVDGTILQALDLDGVDDYLSVSHDSGLDIRRTVSFAAWLKIDSLTGTWFPFLYKGIGSSPGSRTYSLWLNSSSYFHGTSSDSSGQEKADSASGTLGINSWFHLVLLVDRNNGQIRIFKNNNLIASDTVRTTDSVSSSSPLLIGASHESNAEYGKIDGKLDDLRLYNRILTSSEISLLYNSAITDTDSDGLFDAEEFLLGAKSSVSDTDGDGLTDFEEVMGYHTYEQINGSYTWTAAKADAESRGGYLATITSLEEKNKVETIRSSNSWLGASDTQTEGTWQWVTGEPWSYTFWNTGEPNGGIGENYLITYTTDGRWNDGGVWNGPYILEREYFSNPNQSDSDGDGFSDSVEIDLGTDPNSVTTFTFNNAGASGKNGPNATQVNQAYLGTSLQGQVGMVTQGIQRWTVPVSGSYKIEALGASGGRFNSNAGKGSKITGDFELNASDVLNILVGQEGLVAGNRGGGGGGTFVWLEGASSPLLVAGGGGGNGQADTNSMDASLTTSGTSDGGNHYNGGTGGNGGAAGYGNSGGGGGWLSAGGGYGGSKIYQGTGIGGTASGGEGGFGGGGAGESDSSGGGGGYSGGSGGWYGAGGGGSYNSGANQSSSVRTSYGNGNLTITFIPQGSTNQPPVSLGSSNSLQINENKAVGSTVGQFSATDPNGDAITFQLVNGAGDTGNSLFSLETNGTLKTAVVFDYENNASSYSIRVQAKDEHNASIEGNFSISLLNFNEPPSNLSLSQSQINESQAVGSLVGNFTATDPEGDVLSYYLVYGTGDTANSYFSLDTNGSLQTAVVFDYENNASTYSIRVKATDSSNASTESNFTILLNNIYEPITEIISTDLNFTENSPIGIIIGSLSVVGLDADENVTFGLAPQFPDSLQPLFWIDAEHPDSLWQDTAGTSAVIDNSSVALWKDRSGNDNHVSQSNTAYQPAYSSNVTSLNGKKAVNFNGDFLRRSNDVGLSGHHDLTLVSVWANATNNGQNYQHTFHFGSSSQRQAYGHSVFRAGNGLIGNHYWGDNFETSVSGSAAPTLAISSYNASTDTDHWWINGANVGSNVDYISIGSSQFVVGSRLDPYAEGIRGDIAEIILLDSVITESERLSIQSYLSHKWGLSMSGTSGSPSSNLFIMESNGSLKTASLFDYENNASIYSLAVMATDSQGATVTKTLSISLLDVDDTAPLITLNGNANISHPFGSIYIDTNASWSDVVDGSGTISPNGQVDVYSIGSYQLSYDYTDAAGNAAQTVTRTVHVVDTTAPVISLHGDSNMTHEAGFAYFDANASWSDAVDGSGVIVAIGEVNASDPGTYVLSYNYTDAAGNFAHTVTRTVHVVDTTAPVISLYGESNITHEAGNPYIDINASWSDAVDGSGVIVASGVVDTSTPGTYTLSYNYTDSAGNVAPTVTRIVDVVDTTAPVISLHGDSNITHEAGTAYFDTNASWSDAVDGNGTVYASGEVNASAPGTYVLFYNYTDVAGNVAETVTRMVNVVDTLSPVISLIGDANITHEAGFAYLDANASWSDAVDGTGMIVASGEVNAIVPGTYVLFYNYTDVAGNVAETVTRTVNVVDTTASEIVLNGDTNITHEAGTVYLDANASWSDEVDGSGIVYAVGELNASTPGTYELTYDYTDAAGNVAQTVTRTITVVDTTAPVISLNGDTNITHEAGFTYLDANASWSDAVDGSGVIVASGEVNASDPGTYILSYNYTDVAGNAAQTVTRIVHVVDTTAPVISLYGDSDITHEAGNPYIDLNASWSDAVDGTGVIVASGEVNESVPSVYVLSYDFMDAAGNSAHTATRWVEVINLAPEDLTTSNEANLSIFENEPNGTIIGSFEAFDRNPNSVLTFSLQNVTDANFSNVTEQDTNASQYPYGNVFGLEPGGELFSLRPLDYEVDPKHFKILIRATDQFGAFLERAFLVSLENVVEDFDQDGVEDHYDPDDDADGYGDITELEYGFNPLDRWSYPNLPLVRTLGVSEENQTIVFRAEVLSFGGFEQANLGLLIYDETGGLIEESSSPEFTDNLYAHEVPLSRFALGQKIRYQAYAENPTGRNFGPMLEHFIGGEYALSSWWGNDELLPGGWRASTWLGTYLPNRENDWIYHLDLGWLYVQPDGLEGFWFWMPEEKWLWSKDDVWPFLWSDSNGGWMYPIYSSGNRYFYDYTTESLR